MVEWILILTLYAEYPSGGVSIAHISGFIDKEVCMEAGKSWLQNVEVLQRVFNRVVPSYVCINRRKM